MLRVTLERVGPGGRAKTIGHAVIGRWGAGHLAAVADDRTGHHVGKVDGHNPEAGPWALAADAITVCLAGDSALTDQQRRTLEHAMLNLADEFAAEGQPYAELDEDDNAAIRRPGGSTKPPT